MMRISRRSGLGGAALLLFARLRPAVADDVRSASLFADPAAARAIGAAYLRAYPNDALRGVHATARLPRAEIAARVCDDFAAGRVVMVNGWMLSETEARLCAWANLAGGVQRQAGLR
jgi:hypothetical protein